MKNKNVFLIHGAWNTHNSFNYITQKLLDDKMPIGTIYGFNYCCGTNPSLTPVVEQAKNKLDLISKNGLPTIVIGHSMGGLIACALETHPGVSEVIMIASPLSGLKLSMFTHYYLSYYSPVLSDVGYRSKFVRNLRLTEYTKPVKVLIACEGHNPLINEDNDGVISVSSQDKWVPSTAKKIYIKKNHSEILQAPETLIEIEKSLRE